MSDWFPIVKVMQFRKARVLQFGLEYFCYSNIQSDLKWTVANYCCLSNSSSLEIRDSYLSYYANYFLVSKDLSI